jgi:streptomycin 6-kinase
VLDADPDRGALLLERVEPGTMLTEITNDDETVHVAASLLPKLWLPVPASHRLTPLATWCAAYDRNRAAILAGSGFDRSLFQRADALRADLLATSATDVALHGDLHHFNVLRSDRADWLAIDPKGLAGDPHFDLCQFLRNPVPVPASVNRRRLDIFCAELGLDRVRASQWCLVHAVLNACWDFEEGVPWQSSAAYAEQARAF